MSSTDEDDLIRLQVAEEAVRIVRQFNTTKDKEERQKKIIDLCTDIAGILDAKRRLENLVEKQKTELEELRKHSNSARASSTPGKGSVSPREVPDCSPQVSYTPSSGRGTEEPHSPSSGKGTEVPQTPSSERGKIVCDRGTDPVCAWPERTSTCTRSTSPWLPPSSPLSMSSADASQENLTNQEDHTTETSDVGVRRTENDGERSSDHQIVAVSDGELLNEEDDDKIYRSWIGQQNETNDSGLKNANETKGNNSKNTERRNGKNSSKKNGSQSPKRLGREKTGLGNRERKIQRDASSVKSAGEREEYRPKEKSYKTLWKTNHIDVFEDNERSAKQRKNNINNRARTEGSPSRNHRGVRNVRFTKKTTEQCQSESSSSESESEVEEEVTREVRPQLTTEYWDIHKLIRYLKIGNPAATVISLCALRDLNLDQESCQMVILDLGGISILLNLLKTAHWRCVVGSLKILRLITNSRRINMELYRLGGVQQLVECLHQDFKEVQSLAAETLSHVVTFRLAYGAVRRCGGIKLLVNLLQSENKKSPKTSPKDSTELVRNTCFALWSCGRSTKNIQAIRISGAVPILGSLLQSGNDDVILPAMGIVQECAVESAFREDVRREGMVEEIVKHLRHGDVALKTLCANALFKCAEDSSTQELISRVGGLELLVQIIASRCLENTELIAATIGALWKCALNISNARRLEHYGAVKTLIFLLKNVNQSHEILSNALGAMHEFSHSKRALLSLKEEGIIPVVVRLLTSTENAVLVNASRLLSVCAKDTSCRSVILRTDGLRLLWSLLKCPDPEVVSNSASAISECVIQAEESADIVRSFVGGLELITSLLRSDDKQVLISANRAIINIGRDRENLSIMTDYDVVPLLISLIYTVPRFTHGNHIVMAAPAAAPVSLIVSALASIGGRHLKEDEELKGWVAEAIATCSGLEKNVKSFSSAVVPLTDSLKRSSSVEVKRAIACALEKLSCDPYNCYLIHQHDVLKTFLTLTGSSDERVQEAAAGCIRNMRINTMNLLAR